MKLLVCGKVILAHGPFQEDADTIQTSDTTYPKENMPGWSFVAISIPDGFYIGGYEWNGAEVVPIPPPPKTPEELATQAAEAARQAAVIAAKEELALDTISKKSYAEVETYIRGIMVGIPAPAVDLVVKMGKLIKALVDRG